jgi:lipopolysaccharide transport system permease protein
MYLTRNSKSQAKMPFIRKIHHLWDIVIVLVGRDMKLRYKRSALGIVWTMLNPLAQLVILGFVFGTVMSSGVQHFRTWLFTGLLVWNWFASSLLGATSSITDNRDLVRCPEFKSEILPVVYVSTFLVHFLLALPILLVILLTEHVKLTPVLLALPIVIILQFILTLGFGYIFSTIHVVFRDTQYLLSVGLTLAFFVTPIFYEINIVPASYLPLYRLNPMGHIVAAYRDLLLHQRMPDFILLLSLYIISLTLLGLGYLLFHKASARFVEDI